MKKGIFLLFVLVVLLTVFNIIVLNLIAGGGITESVVGEPKYIEEARKLIPGDVEIDGISEGDFGIEFLDIGEVEEIVEEEIAEESEVGVDINLNQAPEVEDENPECDFKHLELCLEDSKCNEAGGFWNSGVCELEPEVKTQDIEIASWNLDNFGDRKADNDSLMDAYSDVIGRYDIIFVQGIKDEDGSAFDDLCLELGDYECMNSSRTDSGDQYGLFYGDGIEVVNWKDFNIDGEDRWGRPPVEVTFMIDDYELVVYVVDIVSDRAETEIDYLEDVVRTGGNVIVLGSMYAGCGLYDLDNKDFNDWDWKIGDGEDTTVDGGDCAYDRIIVNDDLDEEYDDSGVDKKGIGAEVSDHYLVWVEIDV